MADLPSPKFTHPCHDHGLSQFHVRVFHSILSGHDQGMNPDIVRDLLGCGLIRREGGGYKVVFAAYAQWSDWAEQTAKATFIEAP